MRLQVFTWLRHKFCNVFGHSWRYYITIESGARRYIRTCDCGCTLQWRTLYLEGPLTWAWCMPISKKFAEQHIPYFSEE